MFADGSSEGDFETHKIIAESREGSRVQTERINAIIEAALIEKKSGRNKLKEKEWLERVASAISELPETGPPDHPLQASGMNSPKQMTLWYLAALGAWEEARHKDAVKADKILRETGEVVFGSADLSDGLARVVHHNEWSIGKQKAKTKGGK